ncbi:aspartate/glutamate racemase family protein [Paenibacillus soyae]|uniref:Aspartate/glutamate racemase family protein n=1 Tax=Paenibacillus soyae TaxID=2969249 RepID=A0A9X2S907_9BACL|nr:aspartate/glutamate racemase family protein [Paenibacillus soyae]MCR2804964.1 aspartate/glutamate racemase family protein [Paenibacillus soyae]
MNKKIGCLHAHYSNIAYIEQGVLPGTSAVEWIHFVDPGLMKRVMDNPCFDEAEAKSRVAQQVDWIAKSGVDAILITCTNYIALMGENALTAAVPVIKIDEPLFDDLMRDGAPQVLLFTNPATVEGTMRRFGEHAAGKGMSTHTAEARVIDGAFELIMMGRKAEYEQVVSNYIAKIFALEGEDRRLAVAQLSMADAAMKAERELKARIDHPLRSLALRMEALLF